MRSDVPEGDEFIAGGSYDNKKQNDQMAAAAAQYHQHHIDMGASFDQNSHNRGGSDFSNNALTSENIAVVQRLLGAKVDPSRVTEPPDHGNKVMNHQNLAPQTIVLPPGWVQSWSEKANRPYYYHAATGTSQWTCPDESALPPPPPQGETIDDESVEYLVGHPCDGRASVKRDHACACVSTPAVPEKCTVQ